MAVKDGNTTTLFLDDLSVEHAYPTSRYLCHNAIANTYETTEFVDQAKWRSEVYTKHDLSLQPLSPLADHMVVLWQGALAAG